jgi:myo-inositol-1(or 4)-monophosphatase
MSDAADARRVAEAAALAGAAAIRAAGPARRVQHKSPIDLVTEVDLAAEAAVREVLERLSPGVPVLAEEGGGARGGGPVAARWIVDPLDGTTNFVHGFPAYGVSVALERGGELLAGAIAEPLTGRLTSAARGEGAHEDGAPLRVSAVERLDQALLLTGFAYDRRERAGFYLTFVRAFLERAQGIRRAGAAALDFTHIAAGRADGYWEFNLAPWDVAAGLLIVAEAGGAVSCPRGLPVNIDQPQILVGAPAVHAAMLEVLQPLLDAAGWPAAAAAPPPG